MPLSRWYLYLLLVVLSHYRHN